MCGVELSINYFLHFICCFSCFGIFKKISRNANLKKKKIKYGHVDPQVMVISTYSKPFP